MVIMNQRYGQSYMNYSRRRILLRTVLLSLAATSKVNVFGQDSQERIAEYADITVADDWMRTWMDAIDSKGPYKGLHISRFADPIYFTTKEFGWDPDPGQEHEYAPVRVPVGFVTDFASVPRLFWSLFRPDGLYAYAAVVHDFLYWEQPIAKEKADNIFKFLMQDFKIAESSIFALYNAVRFGGAKAWNDNATRRANGEKRILKRLPDDPTVRWSDWKVRSDAL